MSLHLLLKAMCAFALTLLMACSSGPEFDPPLYPNETPDLRRLIVAAAAENDVPVTLVQRVVIRESAHRPEARNGPYYGLMQIHHATARQMGYEGALSGLLDAETNLKYGLRYLKGAWVLSKGDEKMAVQWYARGYNYR